MHPVALPHADFLRYLRDLGREAAGPVTGFFGPRSVSWQVNRHVALHLGGPRALLLQLAHPKVAQGVSDHSRFKEDLFGRFLRTFTPVYSIIFGTRAEAVEAAGAMHRVHGFVEGSLAESTGPHRAGAPYRARDPELVRWVWATLVDSARRTHDTYVTPLSEEDGERWYSECRMFARLMGLSEDGVPEDWGAFSAFFGERLESDEIAVSKTARRVVQGLMRRTGSLRPVGLTARTLAAGMLPPRLREEFGLRWGRRNRALYAAGDRAARALLASLPETAKVVPWARAAERRFQTGGRWESAVEWLRGRARLPPATPRG